MKTTIAFAALAALLSPSAAGADITARTLSNASAADSYDITIDPVVIDTGEFRREGVGFNGASPGPVLIFEEGEEAVIRVKNNLAAGKLHSLARTHSALPDGRRAGHQF